MLEKDQEDSRKGQSSSRHVVIKQRQFPLPIDGAFGGYYSRKIAIRCAVFIQGNVVVRIYELQTSICL